MDVCLDPGLDGSPAKKECFGNAEDLQMKAEGLEPSTYGLKGGHHRLPKNLEWPRLATTYRACEGISNRIDWRQKMSGKLSQSHGR